MKRSRAPSRIHMHSRAHLQSAQRRTVGTQLAAIELPAAGNGSAKPGFWHRLALAVDAYFAERAKRAVPMATLRRSKHEMARCRRLICRRVAVPIEVLSSPQTRS